MTDTEFDVDKIVDCVAEAVSAGKYHDADENEVLMIRLNALEEIVKSYQQPRSRAPGLLFSCGVGLGFNPFITAPRGGVLNPRHE